MASSTASGFGLFWPSSGLVTLVLPPGARLTVGVPAMLTLGVFATFTLGMLAMLTLGVLPMFTVPATLVVPCGAVGTGCPALFTTRTFCVGGDGGPGLFCWAGFLLPGSTWATAMALARHASNTRAA